VLSELRHSARGKLGRALHDYVVVEVRDLVQAQSDVQVEAVTRLSAEVAELRGELAQSREDVRAAEERVHAALRAWERRQRRDLLTVTDIEAAQSSAAFFRAEMDRATVYFAKRDTMAAALAAAPAEGLYLEFGVYSGGTLRQMVEAAPAGTVFGFDSFEGLPEHWRSGFDVGAFSVEGLPDVPGAELVVGWFDATLPGFLADHPEPLAFLHLDADLYSSTKTALDALEDRIRPGTIVFFDEYFNYPGWEEHEHRAWTEFVERAGIEFEYMGLTADDEQVAARVTVVGTDRAQPPAQG
jgi:hypothetical protein